MAGLEIVDTSSAYKPTVAISPAPEELYAGQAVQFSVSASGTDPFYYQWRTNGVSLHDGGNVSGSTGNILIITNLSMANAGNYDVVITNAYGSVTSVVAQLTVVVPVANSYEAAIVSNGPTDYYRLNENSDTLSTANLPAFDYIGADNGVYGFGVAQNAYYGVTGPQPTDGLTGFQAGNGAVLFSHGYNASEITVPSWPVNANTITLTSWIYPSGAEVAHAGLIFNRGANIMGLNYTGSTNINGSYTLGYTWNNDPNTYNWNSGLVPPANQWSLVVLVLTPTNATVYLANTNGIAAAVNTYPHVVKSFSGQVVIGADPFNNDGSRGFDGKMDEVAVFSHALSQNQMLSLFSSASGMSVPLSPSIELQPVSQSPYTQQNVHFNVAALGTSPLGYQWLAQSNGIYLNLTDGGRVSGSKMPQLTINSVTVSDPTNYIVVVTNLYGSITSSPAVLTVTGCLYWNAVAVDAPVVYYALNETDDPAGGNITAFDYVGGFNGLYGSSVKNGNANYAVAGPQAADGFPEFLTNNGAAQIIRNDLNGHVTVSPWNLNTNTVTITAWIRPLGIEPDWSGLVFSRNGGTGQVGLNFINNTDTNGNKILSYTWGDFSGWNSQLAPPTNQWSFVALVVTATNGTVYMFNTNGISSSMVANSNGIMGFAGTTMIGCDPFDSVSYTHLTLPTIYSV